MPTYSYACTVCNHSFDVHQSFSDDALTTCPECQGRLRKVFGNIGVTFKGSGFYRTDHGLKKPAGSGSNSSSSSAKSTKNSSSSSSSSSKSSSASNSGSGSSN